MIFAVKEANFQQEVIEADRPVLVHFWTPWCGLCRLIEPILKKLSVENSTPIKLVAVNADENLKLANYYRLRNLPTIMLFNQGKPVRKMDNFYNRDRLQKALEELMQNNLSLF
ncbi:MAG: thioredoxin domain-containing protein [Cyanobacteria bacterium J06629_2]